MGAFNRWLGGSFLVMVGVFIIVKACLDPDAHEKSNPGYAAQTAASKPKPPPEKPIAVKSEKLHRDYDDNEASADEKYKGRLLLVEGVIQSIDKDMFDNTILILSGGGAFAGVHAKLTEAEAPKARTVKKRQRIEVECRGGGRVLNSAMLDNCAITATWQ